MITLLRTVARFRITLALYLAGCILSGLVYAGPSADVLIFRDGSSHFRLARGTLYLEDPAGSLQLGDVRQAAQQSRFQPFEHDSLQFGYSKSVYWIKAEVVNQLPGRGAAGANERFFAAVRYPLLDDVTLFAVHAGRVEQLQLGDHRSYHDRQFLVNDLIFPMTLAPGERVELYFRVHSTSSLSIPIYLYSEESFVEQQNGITLGDGLYFGITLGLALYNLFIFISVRRHSYAVYVVFVAVHTIFNATLLGYTFALWPTAIGFQQSAVYLLSTASAMSVVWFGMSFLNTAREHPRLHAALRAYQTTGIVILALIPTIRPELGARINVLMTLAGVVIIVIAATRCLREGYRPASYYLVGQGAVLFSVLFTVLTSQNILPFYYLAPQVLKWCSVFELICFSKGLADLLNEERRMREQAQAASHAAQEELLQVHIRLNEELDQKVRERTDALQQVNVQLQQLTITDELTHLYNRRYFNQAFATEYQRAYREKTWIAVLMLDIDHFKQLNDRYGHLFGDLCLQHAARLIRHNVKRPGDAVARYGGEEFVVLLHDTDQDGARQVARTLLDEFRRTVITDGQHAITMTVSIGIAACIPPDRDGHETLLGQADAMLYRAKDGGRDRVEWATA